MRSLRVGVAAMALSMPIAAMADDGARTVAEVTGDINGDGVPDRALLATGAEEEDEVGIAVHLSADGRVPAEPTLSRPAFGWWDGGSEPTLSISPRGSLIVVFHNEAFGRSRWRQQLTIAFRNGELVVAGYTYAARDTLDLKFGGNCDINFLTGKGTRNGKAVSVPAGAIPLARWSDESIPGACAF